VEKSKKNETSKQGSIKVTKLKTEGSKKKPSEKSKSKPKPSSSQKRHRISKQTLARFEIWSVAKISLVCYTAGAILFLLTFWFLWFFARMLGLVKNLESFLGDSLQFQDFSLVNAKVILGVALLVAAFVVFQTVLTVIGASIYNIFAGAVGGVEYYSVEEKA
jgi:hypothetical protein